MAGSHDCIPGIIKRCFTKDYINFSTRASRKEFWVFLIFAWIVSLMLFGLAGSLVTDKETLDTVCLLVSVVIFLIPFLAVSIRRLHDINKRGWWLLIMFVPFIGMITVVVLLLLSGTKGPNRFGPDPFAQSDESSDDSSGQSGDKPDNSSFKLKE